MAQQRTIDLLEQELAEVSASEDQAQAGLAAAQTQIASLSEQNAVLRAELIAGVALRLADRGLRLIRP